MPRTHESDLHFGSTDRTEQIAREVFHHRLAIFQIVIVTNIKTFLTNNYRFAHFQAIFHVREARRLRK